MIPSDHFVRFYNEVFKFLDEKNGLRDYYDEISRHQELHCLKIMRERGLEGVKEYYEHIRKEENCELDMQMLPDRIINHMTVCPSLSKVLDNDAEPSPKYCDHCAGWSKPLCTKCGIYYIQNMISRTKPECISVRTESREVAEEVRRQFLASGVSPDLVNSNVDDWEEVERNKPAHRRK